MNNGVLIQTAIIIASGLLGLSYFENTDSSYLIMVSLLVGYVVAITIVIPISYSKWMLEWWYRAI